jgi:hypothetical protein
MELTTHNAVVANHSDRVLSMNYKTGQNTKTVAWRTRCSCGTLIETKGNNRATHIAKVTRHNTKVG